MTYRKQHVSVRQIRVPACVRRDLASVLAVVGRDLVWKAVRGNRIRVGAVAGTIDFYGYRCLSLMSYGVLYRLRANRVAWMLEHKRDVRPGCYIDHIDGDKLNNNPRNLREVSCAVNNLNKRAAKSSTQSGLLGVTFDTTNNKWRAQLRHSGRVFNSRRFSLCTDAVEAYWSEKFSADPSMMSTWLSVRKQQLALAVSFDSKAGHM